MRVVWTIMRDNSKLHGKMLRDDLIEELQSMGVPEEFAQILLHEDSAQWETVLECGEKFFVSCDIISDEAFGRQKL